MSSTYLHYSSTSGSLPSDYGLLSRYRQHKKDNNQDIEAENNENTDGHNVDDQIKTDETNFQTHNLYNRRRSSFSFGSPPHEPSGAKMQQEPVRRAVAAWSEREPLLGRIPRINEEENQSSKHVNNAEIAVWWNEVRFLAHILSHI